MLPKDNELPKEQEKEQTKEQEVANKDIFSARTSNSSLSLLPAENNEMAITKNCKTKNRNVIKKYIYIILVEPKGERDANMEAVVQRDPIIKDNNTFMCDFVCGFCSRYFSKKFMVKHMRRKHPKEAVSVLATTIPYQRYGLVCKGNPTFESCVEGKILRLYTSISLYRDVPST